jgi:hypothetical protein
MKSLTTIIKNMKKIQIKKIIDQFLIKKIKKSKILNHTNKIKLISKPLMLGKNKFVKQN